MPQKLYPQTPQKALVFIFFSLCTFLVILGALFNRILSGSFFSHPANNNVAVENSLGKMESFKDEEDFSNYLENAQEIESLNFGGVELTGRIKQDQEIALGSPSADTAAPTAEKRYSQTNVQVIGIDEADRVKTDGTNIYYSSDQSYYFETVPLRGETVDSILPPQRQDAKTRILAAFPPETFSQLAEIDSIGDLFLQDSTLIIQTGNSFSAYDVKNPQKPVLKWNTQFGTNSQIVSTRIVNNKLFAVIQTNIDYQNPCPIPLTEGQTKVIVECSEIYHPRDVISTDVTFSVLSLDVSTGSVRDKNSFIGTFGTTVVYMSSDALYATYSKSTPYSDIYTQFITEKLKGGLDAQIGERGVKLSGGQKQRMQIARAIMHDRPILILDEATSNLDSKSEKLVQDALENLTKDKLVIVIAHRFSTIQNADRILVLDGGKVADDGSPSKLARKKGVYSELLQYQIEGNQKLLSKYELR